MQTPRTAGLLCLTVASLLGACGEEAPTETEGVLSIQKAPTNNGDQQTDTVLATLTPFRVLVQRGTVPAQGVTVRWTSPADPSVPPRTTTTDASGIASQTLTFDGVPRAYVVLASVEAAIGSPVSFTATAIPGNSLGTLHVKTTTTGVDLPTYYVVRAQRDGIVTPTYREGPDTSFHLAVNATVAIHLPPGHYWVSLSLGSVPQNCDHTGATSLTVTVPSGGSATAEFAVACVPPSVLAFLRTTGAICTINSNLTAATCLTDGQSSQFGWSPDGDKIAFTSSRDGNSEVYVMNADGTAQIRLTNDPGADVFGSWSPDGSRIAFSSNRDGAFATYVMNADGTNPTSVPNDPGWSRDPALSPDGTKLAVLVERTRCHSGGEGWSGCVTDTDLDAQSLDGSGTMQQLGWSDPSACSGTGWSVTCETRYADPAWSADGRSIAVTYTQCDHSYYGCAYPVAVLLVRADGSGRWTWVANKDDWAQYAWRP